LKKYYIITLIILTIIGGYYYINFKDGSEKNDNTLLISPSNYNVIEEYEGIKIKESSKKIDNEELISLIKDPIAFSNWELLTSNRDIVKYDFQDIDYYKKEGVHDILYFNLPSNIDKLSGNLIYKNIGYRSILLDTLNNVMIIFSNGNSEKTIIKYIQFKDEVSLTDLKIIGGYNENGVMKVVVTYQDYLHLLDADNFEVIKSQELNNWEVISSYTEPKSDNYKDEEMYIYMVDESNGILRKSKVSNDDIIYEHDIRSMNIKGEIIDITHETINILYILTYADNRYQIYCTNEETFDFLEIRDTDDNGKPFGEISDMIYYPQNLQDTFLILFNKNEIYPIEKVYTISDYWREFE